MPRHAIRPDSKKAGLPLRLPITDCCEVGGGRLRVGVWPELRAERSDRSPAPLLRPPDQLPPALMRGKMRGEQGCAGVRNLGAAFIAYAGMQVDTALSTQMNTIKLIVNKALADTDPVTKVTDQF